MQTGCADAHARHDRQCGPPREEAVCVFNGERVCPAQSLVENFLGRSLIDEDRQAQLGRTEHSAIAHLFHALEVPCDKRVEVPDQRGSAPIFVGKCRDACSQLFLVQPQPLFKNGGRDLVLSGEIAVMLSAPATTAVRHSSRIS